MTQKYLKLYHDLSIPTFSTFGTTHTARSENIPEKKQDKQSNQFS